MTARLILSINSVNLKNHLLLNELRNIPNIYIYILMYVMLKLLQNINKKKKLYLDFPSKNKCITPNLWNIFLNVNITCSS